MLLEAHFPVFVRLGQFEPHILSFEKQANGLRAREMLCIPQKLVERRTGAGGHDIKGLGRGGFHAFIADDDIKPEPVARRFQELAFLGGGFEQRNPHLPTEEFCQHQSRESGAAPQICQCLCGLRNMTEQLGAIPDVPVPDIG